MADVFKNEVVADETGRILHIKTTEHVAADHPAAVQALDVHREQARAEGATTEVLKADHPLAVQALPVDDHPLLDRLDEDQAADLRAKREAANAEAPADEDADEAE
jgi:hypothetical protein